MLSALPHSLAVFHDGGRYGLPAIAGFYALFADSSRTFGDFSLPSLVLLRSLLLFSSLRCFSNRLGHF